MTQRAGRVTCPRCGANNFDTVSACWKCQAPLGTGMPMVQSSPSAAAPSLDRGVPIAPVYTSPSRGGDPGVARRAAIALAIALPFIGLPVGWIFMMIEDERKQAIGRICAVWSMVSLVLQLLLMFVAAQSLVPTLQAAVGFAAKAAQQNQNRDMNNGM